MREQQTFILRLWIDSTAPDPVLRGSLQPVGEQQTETFQSEAALLILLKELIRSKPETAMIDPLPNLEEK